MPCSGKHLNEWNSVSRQRNIKLIIHLETWLKTATNLLRLVTRLPSKCGVHGEMGQLLTIKYRAARWKDVLWRGRCYATVRKLWNMTSSFLRFPQRIINKDHSLSLLDKIVVNRKELFKFQLVQLMIKRAVFASSWTPSEQTFLECAATTAFHSKAISSITISFGSIMKLASILPSQINS